MLDLIFSAKTYIKTSCRVLILALTFSFFANAANGQFSYGVKAGLISATTQFHGEPNYYGKSLLFGFTSDIGLGKRFFLSPQLYYAQKGTPTYVGSFYRFDYLSLPVLCGYKITNHLQVLLGVNVGISLMGEPQNGDTLFTNSLQRIDPGLDAGLRYEWGRWGLDFSFVRSLIGIEKTQQTVYSFNGFGDLFPYFTETIPEKDKLKNQSFEFSIYYFFGGRK
jgi:Outer membrane protein beta-barrel domain